MLCPKIETWAHPRWRGADIGDAIDTPDEEGSSPLARGGRDHLHQRVADPGLIPAGAGRTSWRPGAGGRRRAHPRWRGADRRGLLDELAQPGSSPLARGGQVVDLVLPLLGGLIPAGAGRTVSQSPRAMRLRAHPRWRGADRYAWIRPRSPQGSSPLARGGPVTLWHDDSPGGLIPAGAGRTRPRRTACSQPRAHPRWRGADSSATLYDAERPGSSPLARGGLARVVMLLPSSSAHPRWRGADRPASRSRSRAEGSSPLARGGRVLAQVAEGQAGLIPAGAGRTCLVGRPGPSSRAHPRWRGADDPGAGGRGGERGSSPLARGGRWRSGRALQQAGLIPAGAGRTCFGWSGASRVMGSSPPARGGRVRSET